MSGKHGKLNEHSELKIKWDKVSADIKARKANKFGIGGAAAAKQHAKDGIFTKNKSGNKNTKEQDVFDAGYKHHVLREKNKTNYKDEQLAIGRAQVMSMNKIGNSINCMSMTDRDFWAAFKEFVMNEYQPISERDEILKMAPDHKDDCIDLWRVIERKPDIYTVQRKNQRVAVLYERWTRSQN